MWNEKEMETLHEEIWLHKAKIFITNYKYMSKIVITFVVNSSF